MSVLAVVPCLNEAPHLDSLLRQMLADPVIDLLVVADGGSTDGSQAIVDRIARSDGRVALLHNSARIQSAGVNRAVAAFGKGHDWLLRIDAHCEYPKNYAALLLGAAERHGAAAVVVPMRTQGRRGFQLAVATAQNSILGTGGSPHRHVREGRSVDHGHHALMRLDMFFRIGGYCEAMPCNEDAEYDYRQRMAGGAIWIEPAAAITYYPRSTPAGLWRQYRRYGAGRCRTLVRHRMRPHLRQLLPLAVPFALALLPLAFLAPLLAVPAAFWLFACLGVGALVGAQQGGGWRCAAGVAAAIMHTAWGFGFLAERLTHRSALPPRYGLAVQ